MLREFYSRVLGTFRQRRLDQEFDDEVRSHLAMLEERFIAQGMDPREAYYAARRQFGGVTQVRADLREKRALTAIDVAAQDVRHAFRQLGRAKGFTAAAALTLALGIGASCAVFAVLDSVVLRPLPFPEVGRLMAFRSMDRRSPSRLTHLSYPDFFDFRTQNRIFEHLVSYRDGGFTLSDSLPAIQVTGEIVSWDLFPALGVRPELGRGFLPEEENPGTQVVVLSNSLWKSRFAGSHEILGRAIRINGKPFIVVGVAPAGFQFPVDGPSAQLWVTLAEDAGAHDQRGGRMLDAIGRLKPGVSVEGAQAQMDVVAARLSQQHPESKNLGGTFVLPEQERIAGTSRTPLLVLLGAVTMLLMIACANVASMLLARNAERGREFALRTALGAARAAILRQMLIEGVALGLIGTAAGILLALAALRAVLPLAGDSIPRIAEAGIDGRVLVFSMVLALLTSVLFSLAPAVRAAGADPAGALKEGGRSIARGHDRFRNALVVLQITLGLVLLVGAELLMASFFHFVQRDPGFRADHLLTFSVGVSDAQYDIPRQIAFCDQMIEQLRGIPGVQAVATGRPLPLQGHQMRIAFDIEERPAAAADRPRSDTAIVSPGYFSAMGVPLLQGRDFTERDNDGAPAVVVVNQAFARKYFQAGDAIGKRIQPGAGRLPIMREIVGVVGNAQQAQQGTDADPIYYFPYKQLPWGIGTFVVRTAIPPLDVEPAARAVLAALDREVPMHQVRTGEQLSAEVIARMKFLIALMGSFAAVALLLTGTGLYGVLSYSVARRRGEIGVRIALGAARRHVLGMVLRQAMQLVAAGAILGLVGAVAAGRLMTNLLSGIQPGDPVILAVACTVLVVTGIAAAYVPAARAASVDPIQALRSD